MGNSAGTFTTGTANRGSDFVGQGKRQSSGMIATIFLANAARRNLLPGSQDSNQPTLYSAGCTIIAAPSMSHTQNSTDTRHSLDSGRSSQASRSMAKHPQEILIRRKVTVKMVDSPDGINGPMGLFFFPIHIARPEAIFQSSLTFDIPRMQSQDSSPDHDCIYISRTIRGAWSFHCSFIDRTIAHSSSARRTGTIAALQSAGQASTLSERVQTELATGGTGFDSSWRHAGQIEKNDGWELVFLLLSREFIFTNSQKWNDSPVSS
ncbi:hypothetical protein B0H16DRAFT_1468831 [Mycena metata]|uniref:Uncharacterized protein n=1 Tax=Mycena metata TaxID=1033252 RepID=A0AAD7I1K9_9AGAR|nr:hypothetical protein B0H16DRAFT_1468831 [Mycena metata]